jgi:uncharacterized RDD family membrane protein YckC
MQTVTIQTTQNIDIDYEVAGVGERILARLIDMGFFIALVIVGLIIGFSASIGEVFAIILGVIAFLLYVFYDLVCEIFLNGQSFGKRIMKIKVISLNGARPSISQYILRWLFRMVDFGITFNVCALLCVIISVKKQRVGDMVAGTTLIKTAPRVQVDNLVHIPVEEGYVPVFTGVTQLTDNDIILIHEVMISFNKTANSVLIYNMAARIKQHLSISPPPQMNDYTFLQTILKDYNYLTAAMDA